MGRSGICARTGGVIVLVLLLGGAGCSAPAEVTTTTSPTTSTSTTTTVVGAGSPEPSETAPTWPDSELPDSFVVVLEESYICQLGPAGESEIRAAGTVAGARDDSASGYHVAGSGDISVAGLVRAGDICTGEAVGTHLAQVTASLVDSTTEGTVLKLQLGGTWYETWDGEIECRGGLPPSGPWEWPAETNLEILTFSPFENGATVEQDVNMGMCQGTVMRALEF